ncbi:hypothetical protein PO878_04420 [Iamia majanohamensis]|uniref:Uncharacterized protein n=1 Tax=Iamia majanohamensis TaxID=467976 RepID=A0AAE9YG92_9ACTN|nr:hypothetical protein [Iamia majanohamensis]WCO67967.1 hypothetical protein PO878_04420 [Iamia majanohamensis]
MDATWSRNEPGAEWAAAVQLANRVASGGHLPIIPSPVLLDADEALHGDLPAQGWRFHGADVTYAAPRVVAIGGPLMFGLTAAGSAVARRRARIAAEGLAAPQWRPLGALRILATDQRLLVWHNGAWASVWYSVVRELRPDLERQRLDMTFESDPPYCLVGPLVPYLTVIITTLLAGDRGVGAVGDALAVPLGV